MEKELASKIFLQEDYSSKNNMEEHIKEYINKFYTIKHIQSVTIYSGNHIQSRCLL